jgi:hypothetical protein
MTDALPRLSNNINHASVGDDGFDSREQRA